jgi:ubiquinone/menaquinone biosynthesis C-methylase UbiE
VKTKSIYNFLQGKYEKLKHFSDFRGNTLKSITKITPITGKIIVELGAGTGNIAFQLAKQAEKVYGFDNSKAMLRFAKRAKKSYGLENCIFASADHQHTPLASNFADLIIIGWALVGFVADG